MKKSKDDGTAEVIMLMLAAAGLALGVMALCAAAADAVLR